MSKNKKLLINVIVVSILVIVILRVSYAFFTANITGSENSTSVTLNGGLLNIAYAGGNNITFNNTYPKSEPLVNKMFTLTSNNTTDLNMPYSLSLVIDSNTFSNNTISYTLEATNTHSNGEIAQSILTNTGISNGASTNVIGNGYFTNGTGKIHTYVLKIYFLDTGVNQNTEQGKKIEAHIEISSQIATKS